ncbi:tyrosine-type recombinase/integrase, partial [Streptomyces anulatus]|uniref:tyrosine-type recombinase/integrase n=1 Tax=Streptomyces anulatus TaxID=1892 RepID=UPI003440F6C5
RRVHHRQPGLAQQLRRLLALLGVAAQNDLVFASKQGTELDAANVRRAFRVILKRTDLDPDEWTPREMRHSFVSLLSDSGVALENISRLVGHKGTVVTEKVYRKQLRPVLLDGAEAMDRIFSDG